MNQLTLRETEILLMVLSGFSTTEIAEELGISKRTVDSHRRNILKKSNSSNIIGLYKYALSNKLINNHNNNL